MSKLAKLGYVFLSAFLILVVFGYLGSFVTGTGYTCTDNCLAEAAGYHTLNIAFIYALWWGRGRYKELAYE